MKKTILLVALTSLLISCGQQEEKNKSVSTPEPEIAAKTTEAVIDNKTLDSVSVENAFLLNSPFTDGDETDYFAKKAKVSTKTTSSKEKSKYDETKLNTIKTIEWGKSHIQTLTTSSGKVLLQFAMVEDSNLVLKNGIKVGDNAEKVFSTFKVNFDASKKYKFLELTSPPETASCALTFNFENNVLTSILYLPYWE